MDPLYAKLARESLVDPQALAWAQGYGEAHDVELAEALLELDLIGEDALAHALEASFGLQAAGGADLMAIDPALASFWQEDECSRLGFCPLYLTEDQLSLLVDRPMRHAALSVVRERVGVEVRTLIAASHYLELARARMFGRPLAKAAVWLESRLSARRSGSDVHELCSELSRTDLLDAAACKVLDYAALRVDFCGLLTVGDGYLRSADCRGQGPERGAVLPLPGPGCTVGPAVRHGGYFVGALIDHSENQKFFRALGRTPLPAWAFVAPVPVGAGQPVVLLADNDQRGIASHWVAELSLLAARLGEKRGNWEDQWLNDARPPDVLSAEPNLGQAPASPAPLADPEPVSYPSAHPPAEATPVADSPDSSNASTLVQANAEPRTHIEAKTSQLEPTQAASNAQAQFEQPTAPALQATVQTADAGPAEAADTDLQTQESAPASGTSIEATPATDVASRAPAQTNAVAVEPTEHLALKRLREVAASEGKSVGALVDELLTTRPQRVPGAADGSALAGEVKGLFEKLATDIPTQLAQSMAAAFRDLVPRAGPADAPQSPQASARPQVKKAAELVVVKQDSTPRDVPDYRSKRRKASRIKL